MTWRRAYWGTATTLCLIGVWVWLTRPGIELFWLIVWGGTAAICFEASVSNRSVTTWRKRRKAGHGNHK